jgi:hypothetical protein
LLLGRRRQVEAWLGRNVRGGADFKLSELCFELLALLFGCLDGRDFIAAKPSFFGEFLVEKLLHINLLGVGIV